MLINDIQSCKSIYYIIFLTILKKEINIIKNLYYLYKITYNICLYL